MRIQPRVQANVMPENTVSRRGFLKAGISTIAALSTLPGNLFASTGLDLNLNARYKLVPVGDVQRPIILVWLEGGMSHLDSFCPNPDAPLGIRSPYGTIQTTQLGVRISSMLPRTARHLDKMILMRNIRVNDPASNHPTSTAYMFTGSSRTTGRDVAERAVHESFASRIASSFRGNIPGYVAFSTQPGFKTFYPGMAHQDSFLIHQEQGDYNNNGNQPYRLPLERSVSPQRMQGRNDLLRQIDNLRVVNEQTQRWDGIVGGANGILNGNFAGAFDLTRVPDRVREMYGKTSFGNAALVARRMVDLEVPFIVVNNPGWDNHSNLTDEPPGSNFPGLNYKLPEFDKVISSLFTDLGDRAIIAIGSEFGRTPRINRDRGRDHWTKSGFLVIGGAGINPRTFGRIDNAGEITGTDGVFFGELMMSTIAKAAGYEFREDRGNGIVSAEPLAYYPIF